MKNRKKSFLVKIERKNYEINIISRIQNAKKFLIVVRKARKNDKQIPCLENS